MHRPLSTSQIERLGARLVDASPPAHDDLQLLHELLAAYSETLARAVDRVRSGVDVAPTSRIKNTGTILEKLERYGGSWLKSIQDLAGMRIVRSFDRRDQDALVAQLAELFDREVRPPRVVDRRADPVQGYRAVHVVVFPERVPVEIQVRTRWQHEWAELFEKLADRVGRGIRYGEPPTLWLPPQELDAQDPMEQELFAASYEVRAGTVELAIAVADLISAVETIEALNPSDPELPDNRRQVEQALAALRTRLDHI